MTAIERAAFLKLFNNRGYVLNFSTNDFNIFTTESVGEGKDRHVTIKLKEN